MSIVDTVKRAPKWAWITVGGVAIGAVAVRVYQGREAAAAEAPVEGADEIGTAAPGYTQPGVIVPPVILGQSGDQGSAVAGMSVWADAVGGVIDVFGGVVSQLVGSQTDIAKGQQDLIGIALAGPPPGMATQNPSPVIVNIPAPVAAPAQVAAPAPAPQKRIVDTCHSAYNSGGDCHTCSRTIYSDGSRGAPFDCHKVHNGKCGKLVSCG